MATIADLPTEILLRIFQFYTETENQQNLICTVSSVNENWKNVCFNSAIWRKFDGTVSFPGMLKLCRNGSLSITKELVISRIQCLTSCDAKKMFSCLTNLETVNFSQVEDISKNVLTVLAESKNKIKEIQIGTGVKYKHSRCLKHQELNFFFSAKGQFLTAIKISYCSIVNCKLVLTSIPESCPNLEELHLTNIICTRDAVFRTNHFQLLCPKLKVLHLDHNIGTTLKKHPLGFPNLEVFTYSDQMGFTHTDKHLECILFNSPNLKFLSLVDCAISTEIVSLLPARSIEYLYLSKSKISNDSNLFIVLKKWCHSLKQVDISFSKNRAINKAVINLITIPAESQLQFLDLNFTQITSNVVYKVLRSCIQLEVLCLEGCRSLHRGMKKTYRGEPELKALLEKLGEIVSIDPDEEILV